MVTLGMWGNALALRLPSHIAKSAKLRPGMVVELRLRDDGSISVRLSAASAREKARVENADAFATPSQTRTAPDKW